jgi:hypothetical protein
MVTHPRIRCLIVTGLTLLWTTANPSYAQGLRPYVGGSVGTFSVKADEVNGRSAAGGLVFGLPVWRYADAEVEITWPGDSFARSYSGISHSFAPPGSSRDEIERWGVVTQFDRRREVTSNISGVVIFRPPLSARVRFGAIVGVTSQRAKVERAFTPIAIPAGVDPQHPMNVARVERQTQNFGALTVGANLAIALTRHVEVVPDVRYDYGSIGDELNNALRTSVKVLWRF